jgi:hypothetical protein
MLKWIFIHKIFSYEHFCVWTLFCANPFNLWTKYPKPSFTRCNNIPKCNDSFIFVRRMFQIFNATTLMIEVAWSQSGISPCIHYSTIIYIMWCKWNSVPSERTFELSSWSKAMTLFIGNTTFSMVLINQCWWPFRHHKLHHHLWNLNHLEYIWSSQTWLPNLND